MEGDGDGVGAHEGAGRQRVLEGREGQRRRDAVRKVIDGAAVVGIGGRGGVVGGRVAVAVIVIAAVVGVIVSVGWSVAVEMAVPVGGDGKEAEQPDHGRQARREEAVGGAEARGRLAAGAGHAGEGGRRKETKRET